MFSFLFFMPSTWRKRSPNHQPHAIPSRKCCEPRKMTNKRNREQAIKKKKPITHQCTSETNSQSNEEEGIFSVVNSRHPRAETLQVHKPDLSSTREEHDTSRFPSQVGRCEPCPLLSPLLSSVEIVARQRYFVDVSQP